MRGIVIKVGAGVHVPAYTCDFSELIGLDTICALSTLPAVGRPVIDESTIHKAVELLQRAAPGATVIVFGSCVRGEVTEDSDLDVLVVEPKLTARREEMVRLRDVLRPLRIPADVLVVSQKNLR
jgi:predicted nucleotidyltransferase